MPWKFIDDIPIYLQIVDILKTYIVSGKYHSGDRLPAVRDLAMEMGVNPNTVQKAFAELERQGLVQSERTAGRYVSIDDEKIRELRRDLSREYVAKLFQNLRDLGMSDEEIRNVINNWEDNRNGNTGM